MGEQTERDRTPLPGSRAFGGKMPQWAWGLILGALGIGGPGSVAAYFRGTEDPRVTQAEERAVAAEAKVEAAKAVEIQTIKSDVGDLKLELKRQGGLLTRIAAKLRVRDEKEEEEER